MPEDLYSSDRPNWSLTRRRPGRAGTNSPRSSSLPRLDGAHAPPRGAVGAALFQAFQAKGWLRPGLRPRHMSTSRRRAGEPLPAASGGSDPETGEPVHGVHGARATDQPPGGEATRTDLAGSLTMSTTHITTRAAGSTGPRPALQRRSTGVPHQRLTGRHLPATLGRAGAAGAFRRARLR
jgi:hypothetical protein